MNDYEIVDTNAGNIGHCAFCGYKNASNEGHRRKAAWLRRRYAEGLRFKVLHSRQFGDVGIIEYAPASHAWRPIDAQGYLVIHCLMINSPHKGKGLGAMLLDSCLDDARQSKCQGVAVVTSSDSFMAKRDVFIKAGFVPVDNHPPYELLAKKLQKSAPDPRFIVDKEQALRKYRNGLTILAADQCPMAPKWTKEIVQASRNLGLKTKVVHISSADEAKSLPTPYGTFSIIYNGKLIAERPISATRFKLIMAKQR